MLKAFQNKAVFKLWLGQVGSSVGDEVYRVALIWMAVQMMGADTGYLASLQLLAVLLFGIFGGTWADRWSPYRTMVSVDLIRFFITLIPVTLFLFHIPSFAALVVSSIVLSGLGAFFEPALQSVLPIAAKDLSTLKAVNGLMSTTLRLARVLGPMVISVMSLFVREIHFFTLNALSYLYSSYCVFSVRKTIAHAAPTTHHEGEHFLSHLIHSIKFLHGKPEVRRALILKCLCGGAWGLVFGLGFALLVNQVEPKNVKAFGLVMGSYGFGNVIGAILLGNLQRKGSERMIYLGLIWLGVFFAGIALTTNYVVLLILVALSAVGGPLNDLPFTDLVQENFSGRELTKIVRLRMMVENFFTLAFMLISPLLFRLFSVRAVILSCGLLIFFMGSYGWVSKDRQEKRSKQ